MVEPRSTQHIFRARKIENKVTVRTIISLDNYGRVNNRLVSLLGENVLKILFRIRN